MTDILLKGITVLLSVAITNSVNGYCHIVINKDYSTDVNFNVGMEEVLAGDLLVEIKNVVESEGFKVSDYTNENMIGFTAKKHFEHFKDLMPYLEELKVDGTSNDIYIKRGLFVDKYEIDTNVDLSLKKSTDPLKLLGSYVLSQLRFKFALTLPIKPEMSNASVTSNNGKTLEWILYVGQANRISIKAYKPNVFNIIFISATGIFIVVLIIFMLKLKKKRLTKK